MNRQRQPIAVIAILMGLFAATCSAADIEDALATLRAVGPLGAGNEAASAAWSQAAAVDVSRVPELLAALKDANPLAANWIRTAVDTVCERALRDQGALPQAALKHFIQDSSQDPKARRLAYEWLLKVDPKAQQELVPQWLNDPSLELRRDAVAQRIQQGEQAAAANQKDRAVRLLEEAYDAARDRDQIKTLAKLLKDQGRQVDLIEHDGLIVDWLAIGPFDNTDEAGFDTVYKPEKSFAPNQTVQGKHGEVTWLKVSSVSPEGEVDLYAALKDNLAKEQEREVIAYATTEFHSPTQRKVQIRSTSSNAIKIWLNGELVDAHKIYHGGSEYDQYRADAVLIPGANRILVKVCQNAQTQSWTNHLAFQLRVCGEIGGGIPSQKQTTQAPRQR